MSTPEQQRRLRAAQAARDGRPAGRTGRPPAECGTAAAFRRHLRHGETLDEACDTVGRAAEAARQADMYRARAAAAARGR